MSKALRVALLSLLVTLLAAATSVAGPSSGSRNGDPDGPQAMLPIYVLNSDGGRRIDAQERSTADSRRQQPVHDAWKTLLRVYLRVSGIRVG